MTHVEHVQASIGDFNFKLSITCEENNVTVCIKCLLDKCDDDCLLSIKVQKGKDIAILSDYYSDVLKDIPKAASAYSKKLSGCIYAVLCILLHSAMQKNILQPDTMVVIPSILYSKRVISFYESLGFSLNNKRILEGSVNDVFQTCLQNKFKISDALLAIWEKI